MKLILALLIIVFSFTYAFAGDGSYIQYGAKPSSDEKTKVSSNDSTAGYLNGKLVAGTNITLTEGSDGADETLTIASTASGGGGGGNPGGSDKQIQYNDGSNFGGDDHLSREAS